NTNNLTIDDRVTRVGPAPLSEGFDFTWSWLNTDKRKAASLNMFNGFGWNGIGSRFDDHEATLTLRPITAMTIASGLRINRAENFDQWTNLVTDTKDHYVFAHLSQTTVTLTERFNYT